jgi:hypothetical protein
MCVQEENIDVGFKRARTIEGTKEEGVTDGNVNLSTLRFMAESSTTSIVGFHDSTTDETGTCPFAVIGDPRFGTIASGSFPSITSDKRFCLTDGLNSKTEPPRKREPRLSTVDST